MYNGSKFFPLASFQVISQYELSYLCKFILPLLISDYWLKLDVLLELWNCVLEIISTNMDKYLFLHLIQMYTSTLTRELFLNVKFVFITYLRNSSHTHVHI